jgi:hypothetical protein
MVRAARCITRFRTTVVGVGCPGRIVEVAGREPDLTYTVSFLPVRLRGAAVTVSGLTVFDVETIQSHLVCELPRERNQDDQG